MNDTIFSDKLANAATSATNVDAPSGSAGRGALWIGYGVILILAAVGLFVSTRSSFHTHCARPEAGAPVTCRVEQRWFGLVPFSVETVTNVQSVGAGGYKTLPSRWPGHLEEERRVYNHLTIVGASSEAHISHERGSIIGIGNPELADRLDTFLRDPRALRVSAWQVEWLPALVGAVFSFIPALVFLSLIARLVDSMKKKVTGQH